MSMARTPKKRRAAATEATRRWRERRAQGRRLVTIEVAETMLARLVDQGLLSITDLDDSLSLASALSRIISTEKLLAGLVNDLVQDQTQRAQDIAAGDGVTTNAGNARSSQGEFTVKSHLHLPGRDVRGCWVPGVSGNPDGKKPFRRPRR
jgi:hypothetical protein